MTRILRGLSSKFLPCGCLAGIYETYAGEVVNILDAKAAACTIHSHQSGKLIPAEPARDPQAPAGGDSDSQTARG